MEIKPKQIAWDQIPEGWMVQPKYDGECNKLIIKDGQANLQRFEGRSKTDFYPEIIAFDIEEYEGKNLDKVSYGERYSIMQQVLHQKVTWKDGQPSARIMPVTNITSADHTWKEFVKEYEMEGIVVKNPDSPAEQVKLKNWDEDDFKIIGTETTEAGEARGWFISKLTLEDTKGKHVDKGQQFDCKYINYPQTKQAKKDVIGKTAIIKYMKMRGRDGQYLAPRHPSLVEIMEFKK